MNEEQKLFKEELSGEIDRKLFKGVLQQKGMLFDEDLKLIAPLRTYYNHHSFADALMLDDNGDKNGLFEYSHVRGRDATILFKGKPFIDFITPSAFQMYDDWRIYPKSYQYMKFAGWTEMGPGRTLKKICSFFTPAGIYGDGSFLRITTPTEVRVVNLPPQLYRENKGLILPESEANGVIADLTHLKKLEYCHPSMQKRGEITCRNIASIMGVTTDKFTRGGMLVSFNARWE